MTRTPKMWARFSEEMNGYSVIERSSGREIPRWQAFHLCKDPLALMTNEDQDYKKIKKAPVVITPLNDLED